MSRRRAAQIAHDDQERAALAEAEAGMPALLEQARSHELDDMPAGIAAAVHAGQMAVLLELVEAERCEHVGGPGLAATATWCANVQTCRRCEPRLTLPSWSANLCDLCGAQRPVEAIGRLVVGPLLVRYRLCSPCLDAREGQG